MSRDDDGAGYVTSEMPRITVMGGVARMDADTVDMAQAAGLVSTAAGHLASAQLRCHQILTRIAHLEVLDALGWGSLADAPSASASLHLDHAQTSVTLAASALLLQIRDLEQLAVSTFGAAASYGEAEAAAEGGMLDVAGGVSSWFVFSPFGLASTLGISVAQADGTSWRDRAAGGLGGVLGSLNPVRDPFSTPGVGDASALVGAGYRHLAQGTGPGTLTLKHLLGLSPQPGAALDYRPGHLVETTKTVAPITSALDAADAIADLPQKSVSVLRTTHLDGTETWAVFVRGTDDWAPGSTSPFSGEGNFDLMAGTPSGGTALVESALQQAGVPVGAAVGLYGHSAGGIIAMRLSDDPVFRRRYDLRSVTTFGSPTATLTQTSPVPTLHVENNQEAVASLDASVSPATTDRVTVSADLPGLAIGEAHSMSTHREVLDSAIRQGSPAVLYAVEQQQAMLGGPASAGSTTLPLPDVEITVFSPGPPPAVAAATAVPSPAPQCVPSDAWAPLPAPTVRTLPSGTPTLGALPLPVPTLPGGG